MELYPGYILDKRNGRLDYKVLINCPQSKVFINRGRNELLFYEEYGAAFLSDFNGFLKKVGEFIKMGSWTFYKLGLRDSKSIW